MESNWMQQIVEIEQRANSANIALYQLCRAAGVRQGNLTKRKQGGSPSMRVFVRDIPKLEAALSVLEFELAITLIQRINPGAATRIIAMLQTPDAGGSGASSSGLERERDGWRDSAETRVAERRGPDRAGRRNWPLPQAARSGN